MWRWIAKRRGIDRPGRSARRAAGGEATLPTAGQVPSADEPPRGCGWFDSSFELRRGLAVVEHEVLDLALVLDLLAVRQASRPARKSATA